MLNNFIFIFKLKKKNNYNENLYLLNSQQILTFDKKLGPFIPFYDFGYTLYTMC